MSSTLHTSTEIILEDKEHMPLEQHATVGAVVTTDEEGLLQLSKKN